jgi:hypothetical protein
MKSVQVNKNLVKTRLIPLRPLKQRPIYSDVIPCLPIPHFPRDSRERQEKREALWRLAAKASHKYLVATEHWLKLKNLGFNRAARKAQVEMMIARQLAKQLIEAAERA